MSDEESFNSVKRWIEDAQKIRGPDLLIFLVGNKLDMAEKRKVGTEKGQALAQELGVPFIETSAKVGVNVKQLFENIATMLTGADVGKYGGDGKTPGEGADGGNAGFKLNTKKPDDAGDSSSGKDPSKKGGCCS